MREIEKNRGRLRIYSIFEGEMSLAGAGSSTSNVKQIKIGNYILGATIGKGNSAVVKVATHSLTKQKVNFYRTKKKNS